MESEKEERNTKEYWEKRVVSHAKDERRMVWYGQDYKFEALDRVARHILSMFENCTVYDLGCGYGRMADLFKPENYLGIDFSEEMIKLAKEKYLEYKFEVGEIREPSMWKPVDVIFFVMPPYGLDYNKYLEFAEVAVVVISPYETKIMFKNLS